MRSKITFNPSATLHHPLAKALALISGALLLALVTFGARQMARSDEKHASAAARQTSISAYRFAPGEGRIYQLDYRSASSSDIRALLGVPRQGDVMEQALGLVHSFETDIKGELVATVIEQNNEGILLSYKLRNAALRLKTDGQEATVEAEKIKDDLGRDLFVLINQQGKVIFVRFDPSLGNLSRSFARALLAVTQFTFSQGPAGTPGQWEVQEEDPNGQYIARYESISGSVGGETAQSDVIAFRKTRVRYLPPSRNNRSHREAATTITPKGALQARFDFQGGYLESLEGSESQTVAINDKLVGHAETALHLRHLRKETLSAAELSALRRAGEERGKTVAAVALSATESDAASEAAIHRTELGAATLESLTAELVKAETAVDRENYGTPLYLKFKALVYLRPETSAPLGRMLTSAGAQSMTMRVLTEALSEVGHEQAQAALLTVVRARANDWPALFLLIPSLGAVESPTPQTEAMLRELAARSDNWDISSTAQLALGNLARNLSATSPERSGKIVDETVATLNAASSDEVARQMLLVLSNTGSQRALPTIKRFLTHTSPALRAVAASALRWIDDPQCDELLLKAATDTDADVRLEAVVALGFREMTAATFAAQKQAFLKDKSDNVRLAALRNLWQAHQAFPEIHRLVKQAALKDPSKEVRKAATEIVSMFPKE